MPTARRIDIGEARVVTMRELVQNTSRVISDINDAGRPAVVTRHGRFVAIIWPLNHERIESHLLAHLDEYLGMEGFDEDETEVDALPTEAAAAELGIPFEALRDRLRDSQGSA